MKNKQENLKGSIVMGNFILNLPKVYNSSTFFCANNSIKTFNCSSQEELKRNVS